MLCLAIGDSTSVSETRRPERLWPRVLPQP